MHKKEKQSQGQMDSKGISDETLKTGRGVRPRVDPEPAARLVLLASPERHSVVVAPGLHKQVVSQDQLLPAPLGSNKFHSSDFTNTFEKLTGNVKTV